MEKPSKKKKTKGAMPFGKSKDKAKGKDKKVLPFKKGGKVCK